MNISLNNALSIRFFNIQYLDICDYLLEREREREREREIRRRINVLQPSREGTLNP
jgi:hypothetical protein